MAYSHHRVALFGKKASQERLASRISALLDITLNDDDGLPNFMCAKCKWRVEKFREPYLGSQVAEGHVKSLAETLTSHDTEESENSPESPHLGEIKCMCKQCVPGAPPFFVRARRGRG